jgi:hypothetical protein
VLATPNQARGAAKPIRVRSGQAPFCPVVSLLFSNWNTPRAAVAARLAAKELHRLKLRRFDLANADLRLGEKAHANGVADGQAELVSRLDRATQSLTQLRQHKVEATFTFGDKAKAFARNIAKAVQIGALQLKRRRILRQLGAKLRQSDMNSSLVKSRGSLAPGFDPLNLVSSFGFVDLDEPGRAFLLSIGRVTGTSYLETFPC